MKVHVLQREQLLPHPVDRVFPFFAEARNLERITPPLLGFAVTNQEPIEMRAGAIIQYRLKLHGLPVDWLTRIDEWEPGVRFVDQQLVGPYRLWHHTHTFEARGGSTLMRDTVRYALPLWPLGELAMPLVRRDLKQIFDFRRDSVGALLDRD
ncbi:MAG TPA: SRPBCC family protein [Thermoleophilaceae bacterium]|nr:SRPBCC family protein [Thermoleophilaceae bacterium]